MKTLITACALATCVLMASTAGAQSTPFMSSGSCPKPQLEQHLAAGDQPDHFYSIAQGSCKTKATLGTVNSTSAAFSEHRDVTGRSVKAWGILLETYDSGDKVAYRYEFTLPIKAGVAQPGKLTFQAASGTGKLKGIKASGSCLETPSADGGVEYTCTGQYSLPDAK